MRGLLFILMLASLIACQKVRVDKTDKVLTEHSWKIDELVMSGKDITDLGFGEYTFTFLEENSMMHAIIACVQTDIKGNWESSVDEGKAMLYLKVESPLDELNDHWQIKSVSKKQLVLEAKNSKRLVFIAQD